MSRMHPGTPPSRRKDWSGDWRERLRTSTQSFAAKMRGDFKFDDPATRRLLIAGVRLALGETSTAGIKRMHQTAGSDDADDVIPSIAMAYRTIIEGDDIKLGDPMIAESFMVVVQNALDDMCLDSK